MKKKEAPRGQGQHCAMVGEIRRKKEDEQDLAELRGLHGKAAKREPIRIAADAHAEQQREEQDDRRRNPQYIGIGEEIPQTLPQDNRQRPEGDADARPSKLCREQFGLQPCNLRKADGEKQIGERKRNAVQSALRRKYIACGARADEECEPRQICELRVPVKYPSRLPCLLFQKQNAERAEEQPHRREFQTRCHGIS